MENTVINTKFKQTNMAKEILNKSNKKEEGLLKNSTDYGQAKYNYEEEFWKGEVDRRYEDNIEKEKIKRFLPKIKKNKSIVELGAGFGRMLKVYKDFDKIYLVDNADNMLEGSVKNIHRLGLKSKASALKANLYNLSGVPKNNDVVVLIRVFHHIKDLDRALKQINSIVKPGGYFIMEYANKRNLLEIFRYYLGKPNLKPFDQNPSKRGSGIFYNFHPTYMENKLKANGFAVKQTTQSSLFRSNIFKKVLGVNIISYLDILIGGATGSLKLSPSIFYKCKKVS